MWLCMWKFTISEEILIWFLDYFNIFALCEQFWKIQILGPLLRQKRVPFGSPFCQKLGPLWVPFLQFLGPLVIWEQCPWPPCQCNANILYVVLKGLVTDKPGPVLTVCPQPSWSYDYLSDPSVPALAKLGETIKYFEPISIQSIYNKNIGSRLDTTILRQHLKLWRVWWDLKLLFIDMSTKG